MGACRSENLREEHCIQLRPVSYRKAAILKAPPLPPVPPATQLLVTGRIGRIGRTDRPGRIVRMLDR